MSSNQRPLSVAELIELPTDSWVNDGFTAVIRSIERKVGKPPGNKVFFKCVLADTTGSATVGACLFFAPKFKEGDSVDFLGQGIKFKNGQYGAEVSMGDKAEIHVVGKSVHAQEQAQRAATGAPALNGTPQLVNWQTVGMAMKEGLALAGMAAGGITREVLKDPLFWQDVKVYAGNIIRISRSLEVGKLAPPSWPTPPREEAPPAAARPPDRSPASPPRTSKPTPGPDGAAFPAQDENEEEVPF